MHSFVTVLLCVGFVSAGHSPYSTGYSWANVHSGGAGGAASYGGHGGYEGQIGVGHKYFEPAPLNHDGTVAETPEVAHAKAAHLAEHAKALALAGPQSYEPEYLSSPEYEGAHLVHHVPLVHAPIVHAPLQVKHYEPAPLNHDGTVAETPEVQHAKALHLAEHAKAAAIHASKASYPLTYIEHGRYRRSYYEHAPLKHDGTVDETPEVKHATAAHLAAVAHAKAAAYSTPYYGQEEHYPVYTHHTYAAGHSHHYEPAPLNHDGTVADTHEIKAAKAHHFAAVAEAKARAYHGGYYGGFDEGSSGAEYHSYGHKHYEPAPLNHDGTVADTHEIKAAKAHHFAAIAEAKGRLAHKSALVYSSFPYEGHSSYSGHKHFEPAPLNHDGTVADTPAIKHVKAALAAAHHEALSRIHHYYY